MTPIDILLSGLETLQEYLSAHVLSCLIPAFFIAGAIAVFISKESILKYFGVDSKKYISYSLASVSGAVLAVCSCTILPLFSGMYKRGAGIGPATTFLFSGPAINILAIILTARVLGYNIGIARVIGAVIMSIVIGLSMGLIFKKHDIENKTMLIEQEEKEIKRPLKITAIFFILLVSILVIGATSTQYISWTIKLAIVYLLTITVLIILIFYYTKDEVRHWGMETWDLTKKILPILLIGVFIVGIVGGVAAFFIIDADPSTAVGVAAAPFIGSNSIFSTLLASVIGALLYMPTLLEVAIVGNLFGYSSGLMGDGPALSLLLAGPSLSLPNMIVIVRVMGTKKALIYILLVIFVATVVGFIYGLIAG